MTASSKKYSLILTCSKSYRLFLFLLAYLYFSPLVSKCEGLSFTERLDWHSYNSSPVRGAVAVVLRSKTAAEGSARHLISYLTDSPSNDAHFFQPEKNTLKTNTSSPPRGAVAAVLRSKTATEGSAHAEPYFLIRDSLKRAINREANRASLMSALLPGLGQVYNKKYWKVPVIYAALAGIGYFAVQRNQEYQDYRNELLFRYANTGQVNTFAEYSTDNLVVLKNQVKKYRDMCFIGMGIFYVLNIIDANVDAHLKHFDVSDNLSLSVRPKTYYCVSAGAAFGAGISLALSFK